MLKGNQLALKKQGKTLLHPLSFSVAPGEFKVLLGQNGAGKSSLIRMLAGFEPELLSQVLLQGQALRTLGPEERSQKLAWLPSDLPQSFPYRVEDILLLGRYPWHRGSPKASDFEKVKAAFSEFSLEPLKGRNVLSLSSGEQKLMHLARVFSGDQNYFLFDEPEAHLDLKNKTFLFRFLKAKAEVEKKAILVVSHEVQLAKEFATSCAFLKEGRLLCELKQGSTHFSLKLQEAFDLTL